MKKNKYLILAFLLSLINITTVYASCTQEEINEFKKVEDQYKVTYEYNRDTKTYTINFKKDSSEKYNYKIYASKEFTCENSINHTTKCNGLPQEEYDIEIYSSSQTCTDVLKTIYIDLTNYNKYAEDPLCEGIEEFVLCNPTYKKDIDYETFVSRIETYKKTKDKKTQKEQTEKDEKNEIFNNFKNFIKNNLYTIIISVIFSILLILTIILSIKTSKKSRRLE